MHARERRQLRLFIRRDTYGRYVSVLVYLPRDRYNTTVRERFSEILQETARRRLGRVHRAGDRVDDRARALRGAPAARARPIHEVDTADLERRLAEASRSWRDDFVDRGARRVRRGGRRRGWPGATSTRSRRPTRRTSRRGSRRSTSAGSRRSRSATTAPASTCRSTRTSTPAAARRGSRSSGSARRCRCPRCCRCCRRWASRSSTSGPTSSTGWTGRRTSTSSGCATAAACPTTPASCSRTRSARSGTGCNEIDGFNALVLGAGLTWRQATRAARLREVHAAGRTRRSPSTTSRTRCAATSTSPGCWCGSSRPGSTPARDRRAGAGEAAIEERIARALDDVASLDHDRILRSYLTLIRATLRTNYFQPDADGGGRSPTSRSSSSRTAIPDLPAAAAEVRDLRVLAAGRGRAPALRRGRARRAALVRPARRLPHRGARPGQGADGEEHRDRAGRREGRLLLQAAARPGVDRDAWLAEGVACYTTFISGLLDITDNLVDGETVPPARRGPPRRRRLLPRGRRRQGHRDLLRHRQRRREGLRLLARRRVRLRRLGRLRPQGDGHHRARRVGVGAAALPRARHRLPDRGLHLRRHRRHVRRRLRQRHALLGAHPAGRGLRPPRHLPRPDPDAATSYAERQRLFELPRSSWQDYDTRADLRGRRRLLARR